MAEENTYRFLPDEKCLTEQQLFDYIDGKLSHAEMHLAEKHLLDCGMCADALEGFEKIKDRKKVASFSSTTNKKPVNENIPAEDDDENSKVIPLWSNKRTLYSIAAAIVLLLGITVVMKMSINGNDKNESSKLANNVSIKNDSQSLPSADKQNRFIPDSVVTVSTARAGGSQKTNQNYNADETQNAADVNIDNRKESEAPKLIADIPAGNGAAQPDTKANLAEENKVVQEHNSDLGFSAGISRSADDEVVSNEQTNEKNDNSKAPAQGKKERGNDKKSKDAAPAAVPSGAGACGNTNGAVSQTAVPAYNYSWSLRGDTTSARDLDSKGGSTADGNSPVNTKAEAIADSVTTVNTNYQDGVKMLDAGKAKESLDYFDAVLKNPADGNFQDAQWKKAEALIQLKRIDEAKTLLNAIVAKNGKYKTQAQEKLKTL